MAPINDNIPTLVSGETFTVFGSNVGALPGPRPFPLEGNLRGAVWWEWRTPPENWGQEYALTTLRSNFDTGLSIFPIMVEQPTFPPNLGGSSDNFPDYENNLQPYPTPLYQGSTVLFQAFGVRTLIAVGSFTGAQGDIELSLAKVTRGDAGRNAINGNGNNDWILGGGGNDTINGNGGNDFLFGEAGNDRLAGTSGSDYLSGGDGRDVLYGNGGRDILAGGNDADTIYGGSQDDIIFGGAGNDVIYANGGGDYIDSGAGLDTLWLGGAARVVLSTGEGHDVVHNFQIDQTKFALGSGLNYSDLSFANSSGGTRISARGDLLAVVRYTSASVFTNNPDIFVSFYS